MTTKAERRKAKYRRENTDVDGVFIQLDKPAWGGGEVYAIKLVDYNPNRPDNIPPQRILTHTKNLADAHAIVDFLSQLTAAQLGAIAR